MEQEELQQLQEGLDVIDRSELFLAAIIAGALLVLWSLAEQRKQLRGQAEGRECPSSLLYPLRHTASALTVGGLGFFLCLAIKTLAGTDREDPVSLRSAQSNLTATALVFAAALLRFCDVQFLRANGRL